MRQDLLVVSVKKQPPLGVLLRPVGPQIPASFHGIACWIKRLDVLSGKRRNVTQSVFATPLFTISRPFN